MRAFLTIAALLWLSSAPARAQDAPRWVDRCATGSADARAAGEALDAFSAALHAHDPSAPLTPLRDRFDAIMRLPCFAAAAEASRGRPTFRSLALLRAWWADGGLEWLHHYAYGVAPGARARIVFPPTERRGLSLESTDEGHALRALMCSERDATCGLETAGWALRAEVAFEAHAVREQARRTDGSQSEAAMRERIAQCERDALAGPAERRFITWYTCVDRDRAYATAMPLGRIRAPLRGWLIVRGRRGHHSPCEELRAYDLATGAAYVTSSCQTIAGASHGRDVVGRMPVDALREVVWMLLVGAHVDDTHRAQRTLELSVSIGTRWQIAEGPCCGMSPGGWGSSDQTRLDWSWVDGTRVLASGTLTWPDSSDAEQHHADDLLRVAEAAIVPGCAPSTLPRALAMDPAPRETGETDEAAAARFDREHAQVSRLRAMRAPRCR